MTGVNKICLWCPIGQRTPDRCSPENHKLSNSSPSASNEGSTQSSGLTYDASGAKDESQGLAAPLREDAPWNVRYKKTEETLENVLVKRFKDPALGGRSNLTVFPITSAVSKRLMVPWLQA
ncbi:uncharacterized protein EAE98_005131 [Botrytis deweyae]|uniref:Uncharacterized protein n=1 Tax=Botrytis deweyae TaxID=2478750 RepID=A0ABQ7IN00_9HELO|nr:uncharacterized protein EAE98_005131 [Botrytis deweyae]KAF7929212.1 hypothetical protein EAE98_005131 [Botrytis deweyae]